MTIENYNCYEEISYGKPVVNSVNMYSTVEHVIFDYKINTLEGNDISLS